MWGKEADGHRSPPTPLLFPQETRFVDGRAILQWDIFASNGIIHVISRPLKAPPAPLVSIQGSWWWGGGCPMSTCQEANYS